MMKYPGLTNRLSAIGAANLQKMTNQFSLGIALIATSAFISVGNAQAVTFTPPSGGGAPSQSTGGASRGMVLFSPAAKNAVPVQSTGGASRGSLFTPTSGQRSPHGSMGGASRGQVFTPAAGNGAPSQGSGGASRGQVFTPAAGNGAPSQGSGGASRVGNYPLNAAAIAGSKSDTPLAMIAVLPQTFYGTTVSAHPTILVYLPASIAKEAVFSLKDEAGNTHTQMTVPVSGQTGIMAVKLPAEALALEIGKNYQWFLALKVDGKLSPSTPYVNGWVRRIQPGAALASALKQPDVLKQATALGANGVWYDCVATLATLRATQSNSAALAKDWSELLSSVGLKEIAQAPLVISAH